MLEPMSARVPRLFVAVWPSAVAVDVLRRVPHGDDPGVRWSRPRDWHVTLRFLGPAAPAAVAARLDATSLPAATARLGPVVRRLGRGSVVVPVAGLDELAAAVTGATADLGQPPDPRPFVGHLTLARTRDRAACGAVGRPCVAEFAVGDVVLVDSTTHQDGATYRVLGRWPVRSPG